MLKLKHPGTIATRRDIAYLYEFVEDLFRMIDPNIPHRRNARIRW